MLRQMKHFAVLVLSGLLCAGVFSCCVKETCNSGPSDSSPFGINSCGTELSDDVLSAGGWNMVFKDDFNSSNLDTSKWTYWTTGAYNNELQCYQRSNITVRDGMLVIESRREAITRSTNPSESSLKSFSFTSGRIETATKFGIGSGNVNELKVVARIRLPEGYGMWPAFWLYGDPWPTQGEIDILEARGQEPRLFQSNYFYGDNPNQNLVTMDPIKFVTNTDLTACWHVYEMTWHKDSITVEFDGVLKKTMIDRFVPSLYGKMEKVVFNIAVGGDFFPGGLTESDIQPGTMYVDWVRVLAR